MTAGSTVQQRPRNGVLQRQRQNASDPAVLIRRPTPDDWPRVLEILETANFHRIGGPEMPEFPPEDCFVAEVEGVVAGVAGYRILNRTTAKTTLMAVHPDYRGGVVGLRLQSARMDFLRSCGIQRLRTNVDDPRLISWYRRRFGYVPTGDVIPKEEPFGRADKHEWITLEVRL